MYQTRGNLDKAIWFNQKSLTINIQLGRKEGMAINYRNLGNIAKQQGDKTKAISDWKMSVELYKYLGSPNEKLVQGWLDTL